MAHDYIILVLKAFWHSLFFMLGCFHTRLLSSYNYVYVDASLVGMTVPTKALRSTMHIRCPLSFHYSAYSLLMYDLMTLTFIECEHAQLKH